MPIAGADESRWASRTSNPLGGIKHVSGGFDSHALPPEKILTKCDRYGNQERYLGCLYLRNLIASSFLAMLIDQPRSVLSRLGHDLAPGKQCTYRFFRIFSTLQPFY